MKRLAIFLLMAGGALLVVLSLTAQKPVAAQGGSPLHPTFALLDENGDNVLASGQPVSTMKTCGACHDTDFIAGHSFHADVGLSNYSLPTDDTWNTSPALFGRWDPLTYRYLSPMGDEILDLTTAEWIQVIGVRHVGGGPAQYSRDGQLLTDVEVVEGDPETHIIDPASGELVEWDWQESGIVEMNCFLCHFETPNNDARVAALQSGQFGWANSATLMGTGVLEQVEGQYTWNPAAFAEDGTLLPEMVTVQDPKSANCGLCHGIVHTNSQVPLNFDVCEAEKWSTITTGQIYSSQPIINSGLNLDNKTDLTRTWDVHIERVVECVDCHPSTNNPIYYREDEARQPEHLEFDPRRLDFGDYLYRPIHEFDNTLRDCDSCHNTETTHDWLQYKQRHMDVLSCEACHVPKLYGPAYQSVDWTVLETDGTSQTQCRGVTKISNVPFVQGFEPVLLPVENSDGDTTLAPHNLITAWFWVYGNPERPVPLRDLQAAWLQDDSYHPAVLAVFDANQNGQLEESELVIDSTQKETLIANRLRERGFDNPRITGQVQAYSIHHNVTHGDWATRDCQTCHTNDSRLNQAFLLANTLPGGVMPTLDFAGELTIGNDGKLYYQPDNTEHYILGHDRVPAIDWFGAVLFVGILVGVSLHSGLRVAFARRRVPHEPKLRRVYMYSVYERQWHWLQTLVIMGLLFTGLIIHKPDLFGLFSFRYVVQVHNILALILLINAALAAFYHLASGEIRQFLPEPHGFFNQAFAQALYYLRGIFRGDPHPFQKTPEHKMNPLQQVTYLMILNVLLPLQVITGVLMWGAQRWPDLAHSLGGLPFLAPFHSLIAWLFASFIVLHVYLTTTGHTPLAGIQAMIMGWDELEEEHA